MLKDIAPSTKALGFWSALLATVFSITYIIAQLAEWLGLMGSGGGAENASTPLTRLRLRPTGHVEKTAPVV